MIFEKVFISTDQSPQRVTSMTSCWGPKRFGRSQLEPERYAADGLPSCEMSIESVAVVTEAGTSFR